MLQRVREASVRVGEREVGSIGRGMLVLVGVERGDEESDLRRAIDRVARVRLFEDGAGKMNLDLEQVGGAVLAVPQFTLAGSLERGRRPSFEGAMQPEAARDFFERFVRDLRAAGVTVATGEFGQNMAVHLVNDGPVTFVVETRPTRQARGGEPAEPRA